MQTPVQISFHGLDSSEAVENRIREKVAKLEQFFDRITSARVVIEHHHNSVAVKDQPFHVQIFLEVPGEELVVTHDPKSDVALKDRQDINIALRDAFATMQRQLRDYVSRMRQDRHTAARAARDEAPI